MSLVVIAMCGSRYLVWWLDVALINVLHRSVDNVWIGHRSRYRACVGKLGSELQQFQIKARLEWNYRWLCGNFSI